MGTDFGRVLSELRRSKSLTQRTLAQQLKISQGLLSQYENGTREPGIPFICHVCDYFDVSADFMLGRTIVSSNKAGPLDAVLRGTVNTQLHHAAREYMKAAEKRIAARLTNYDNAHFYAAQSSVMANAELDIVRTVSEPDADNTRLVLEPVADD